MPEPSISTENVFPSYLSSAGSNSAGIPINRTDGSGLSLLPPLPHPPYTPGQLVDPNIDSSPYMTLNRPPSASTPGFPSANVDRNNPMISNANSEPIVIGPPSSAETSLYRGDPSVSKDSHLPQPYLDVKIPLRPQNDNSSDQNSDEYAEDDRSYDSEDDESECITSALLSHLAVRLWDRVPRRTHVKGSIPYPWAFTGKDIVSTIQAQIQRGLLINHGVPTNDSRVAIEIARSLHSQLFFYEVEWDGRTLTNGVDNVYMFLGDQKGVEYAPIQMDELPTGVVMYLTRCYTPRCVNGHPCYAYSCPRRGRSVSIPTTPDVEVQAQKVSIEQQVLTPEAIASLTKSEVNRQSVIHNVISKEQQYVKDLDFVEEIFIRPLRNADPPIILDGIDDFIGEVFGNILDLRECNRHLLKAMHARQRENGEIISRIGDIFLTVVTEFQLAYSTYIEQMPKAEQRLKEEMEKNGEFRAFVEQCFRHPNNVNKMDLKNWLNRPSQHLYKYPVVLEAIRTNTAEENPDIGFLKEAAEAMRDIQSIAQLRNFQAAMGKGPTGRLGWYDLVHEDVTNRVGKQEAKRQAIMFELILVEMTFVKDLENIDNLYIQPLRSIDPPIIPPERLDAFIQDVFHNISELCAHHRQLLDRLFEIQREEHPIIRSVAAPIHDAVLNFRDAYLEYVPNYPIAAYRIDEEIANNPRFKDFVDQCVRHPDAHRLDIKSFINRPIPRFVRYIVRFHAMLRETPAGHEDLEMLPVVSDAIKRLVDETEPGVILAKQKVDIWRYNANLVFKVSEYFDMDLLNENRSLIHTGKLLLQPETGAQRGDWIELFVMLFDNYLILTKPREKDGIIKYRVYKRPIPLDLLTLLSPTDPPTETDGRLAPFDDKKVPQGQSQNVSPPADERPDFVNDTRAAYVCTIQHNGGSRVLYNMFADSSRAGSEWKAKLEEAIGLRKAAQESIKVFEVETLSVNTFFALFSADEGSSKDNGEDFTGKITCSVPFTASHGRHLVAIGSAKGVWIGFKNDSRSMQRVLSLRMVTQCAVLDDLGVFLVLADKSLFAYHIEALVPSSPVAANTSQTPQKLSGNADVQFFAVGKVSGKTLVIYMKKKKLDSVFRVLEPVIGKIDEKTKTRSSIGARFSLWSQRSEWFRVYRDFHSPLDSYNSLFVGTKVVILCSKGFKIIDLSDLKSVTFPQKEDPRLEKLVKRVESSRPLGMFKSTKDEFLLCYDKFGLYVDENGGPSRNMGTVEWEGTAERVAWHAHYLLLFDSQFIEIRHVETGRLVQIIPGNDIRCIWDGRGTNQSGGSWDEVVSRKPGVHAVMNMESPRTGRGGVNTQHVFELVPKVPLYLPGSSPSPPQVSSYLN